MIDLTMIVPRLIEMQYIVHFSSLKIQICYQQWIWLRILCSISFLIWSFHTHSKLLRMYNLWGINRNSCSFFVCIHCDFKFLLERLHHDQPKWGLISKVKRFVLIIMYGNLQIFFTISILIIVIMFTINIWQS